MHKSQKKSKAITQYAGWAKRKAAAGYAGVSQRTFSDRLKSGDLRYIRLPSGTILTRYEWINRFLGSFEVETGAAKAQIDNVVDGVIDSFCK